MPIGRFMIVKCKHCRMKFSVMIGDVRPQIIKCPKCKKYFLYYK